MSLSLSHILFSCCWIRSGGGGQLVRLQGRPCHWVWRGALVRHTGGVSPGCEWTVWLRCLFNCLILSAVERRNPQAINSCSLIKTLVNDVFHSYTRFSRRFHVICPLRLEAEGNKVKISDIFMWINLSFKFCRGARWYQTCFSPITIKILSCFHQC